MFPWEIVMANRRSAFATWSMLITALWLTAPPATAQTATPDPEIIRLLTRGDVALPYLLLRNAPPPKIVAVLLSGGYGLLRLRQHEGEITIDPAGVEFLVKSRESFVDDETAVALVDAPSDQVGLGLTPRFRKSDKHLTDLGALVGDLRGRFPNARIALVGNSLGTISAAYGAIALADKIDAVVLSATVFEWLPGSWRLLSDSNLSGFEFSSISAPILVVHHADDRCVGTPFSSVAKLEGKYPLLVVHGGEPVRDNGCGPLGPHGYLGREESVVSEIKNWLHGRPARSELH